MWYILLLSFVFHGAGAKSSWECIALGEEIVPNGETFVPGPDYCTVCKCEKGKARFCQAVLCQQPQDCKSFRLGKSCCDFQCMDNMLPNLPDGFGGGGMSTDLGLRMVASAVTAILSLALLLFLVHRLRQRRLRAQQQYYEDQLYSPNAPNHDSCHSNTCCQNAAYCSGNDHVDFFLDGSTPPYSLWKPPSFYFPHEDAPPPYSEVVSSSNRPQESGASLPPLRPVMVQLGSAPGQSSDASRGTLAVIGAIGGTFRNHRSSSQQPCCITSLAAKQREVTLRSDEVYEDVDGVPLDLPPPYYPPTQPLNDLNRDTSSPRVPDMTANTEETTGNTESEVVQTCCCEGKDASCNLCAAPDQSAALCSSGSGATSEQLSTTPVRLRAPKSQASPRKRESAAALEEFQLRLSMDMSDSSVSSDAPTRTFSSSSDDSTSMDTTSEMR